MSGRYFFSFMRWLIGHPAGWFLGLAWGWVLWSSSAQAQTRTLVVQEAQGQYPLGSVVELLPDPSGRLTLVDIMAPIGSLQFQPAAAEIPNLGFTNAAYWLRFQVQTAEPGSSHWFLVLAQADLQDVQLYLPTSAGQYQMVQTGSLYPFDTRPFPHHYFVFPLTLTAEPQTIYLRITHSGSLVLPLTLWSTVAFTETNQLLQLALGLFYGSLLMMLAYNASVLLFLRDLSYSHFFFFLVSYLLAQAVGDGLALQFLWPSSPGWNQTAGYLFATAVNVSLLNFARTFLATDHHLPRWHKVLLGYTLLWLCFAGLVLFVMAWWVLFLMFFLIVNTMFLLFFVGWESWRVNYAPAGYFLIAWIAPVISTFLYTLVRLGFLPSTPITENLVRVGVLALVLLLSLALADRINLVRSEGEKVLAEAQRSRELLEQRVKERTAELAQAKASVEERAQQLATLNLVTHMVATVTDLSTAVRTVTEQMTELFSAHGAAFMLLNPDRTTFTTLIDHISPETTGSVLPLNQFPKIQEVVLTQKTLTVYQPQFQASPLQQYQAITQRGVQSILMIPLIFRFP